ncbi:hypothetical protein [Adhaeribacter rhizoryzae]|uniref:Uncharacterized protein n=1 Tax=Adhaeribacter rhizoryzae TaxID=2607907 RepID=A0A5M6DDQ9_9BACT|nr:hypothetical protein [Adhaeribacter rhizoryzae]KAA5545701.1 hypothetical protein F0145_12255 [Adhaeribacter rhizoryzae]
MNPKVEGEKGRLEIKVKAGFLGVKFLPKVVAFASTNFNPKLILSEAGIEYRAFLFTSRIDYSEIEKIDILIWIKTNNIYFIRTNSIITVSLNTNNETELYTSLHYLVEKGCVLSERAEEFYLNKKNKIF